MGCEQGDEVTRDGRAKSERQSQACMQPVSLVVRLWPESVLFSEAEDSIGTNRPIIAKQ